METLGGARTLSAVHFGKRVEGPVGLVHGQACAPESAAELRRIAEVIEAGSLWLESVKVESSLKPDALVTTTLTIVVTETIP